jgi:hypothetical protein
LPSSPARLWGRAARPFTSRSVQPHDPSRAVASEDHGNGQASDREERGQDQDRDPDPPPGDAGGLFTCIDVFGPAGDAGLCTGNATNIVGTSEAHAPVIEAHASEAVPQAGVIEAARHCSEHPEG